MKQISIAFAFILCFAAASSSAQTSKVLINNDKVKVTEYM
jgi:hypothetical protein